MYFFFEIRNPKFVILTCLFPRLPLWVSVYIKENYCQQAYLFFMKKPIFTIKMNGFCQLLLTMLFLICIGNKELYAQDLPSAVANIESIGTGSYIIPLDEDKQSILMNESLVNMNFVGFNIAAYGLAYYILDGGIPIKWVMRTEKEKDEIDFTAPVTRLYPTSGTQETLEFRSSAFVIDINDLLEFDSCDPTGSVTNLINEIIEGFAEEFAENGLVYQDVAVYQLEAATNMDVRYKLTYAPKIAVLNDGFSSYVHEDVLEEAGIPFELLSSSEFFEDYDCYTFISQPHLDNISNNNYIPSVQDFVVNGGNFFAQCIAVETFENEGHFHTDEGFFNLGDNNISYEYAYPDMAVMQFEGELSSGIHGSLDTYGLSFSSNWLTNTFIGIVNENSEIISSVADVNDATPGGNVTYLAGHDFEGIDLAELSPWQFPSVDFDTELPQNQQHKRIYLNAAFIPANISFACAGNDACICPEESVVLGCDDLSEDVNYTWSPAAGLSCTDCPHPVASPLSTTTYTIQTPSGCSSSSVTVSIINEIPEATISGGGFLACEDPSATMILPIEFTAGTPPFSFVYGFNDVPSDTIISTENSYNLTVSEPGEYTLLYLETALSYCFESIMTGSATVNIPTGFSIDIGPDTLICEGTAITIDATYADAIFYQWQDGSNDPTFTTTMAGIYGVVVTDSFGCQASDNIEVSTYEILGATDLGDDLTLCPGDTIELEATTLNATEYMWNNGEEEAIITVTEGGTYWVTVNGQCESNQDSIVVDYIPELPNPDLGPDLNFCIGNTVALDATTEGATSYLWNDGTTVAYNTFSIPGTYWVEVSNDCETHQDSIGIAHTPELAEPDLGPDMVLCIGNTLELDATTEGATSYLWSDGTALAYNTLSTPGTYWVQVSNDCETDGDSITINYIPELPSPNLGPDVDYCIQNTINLDVTTEGATTYLWSDGTTVAYNAFNAPGTYWVEVSNTCETKRDEFVMNYDGLELETPFYVPNAFSPNRDGVNDLFKALPNPNVTVISFEMQVYNRWGQRVKFLKTVNDNWDGIYLGTEMELGVYVWFYKAVVQGCVDASPVDVFNKGNVTLIR